MMRRVLLAAAAAGIVALSGGVVPAHAQVPAPPPQTAPVFELLAPTLSPACGNAQLVAVLAPGIIAGETGGLPIPLNQVTPLLGPVFVVCGAVPGPPARLTCDADRTLNEAANAVVAAAAGTPLPVGDNPFGDAIEQTVVIEDKLPIPSNVTALASTAIATLHCTAAAPITAPAEPPAADGSSGNDTNASSDESVLGGNLALAPLLDTVLAPTLPASPALTSPDGNQALGVAPAAALGGNGFAYPVVFALPLVLLVVGGFLGRSLTRPIEPSQR